jgi:transposase
MAREECSPAPRYIAINRNQQVLQPLDVDRLIDADHAARKIWRVVEQLDLSRFEEETRAVEGAAGRPSHAPQVLVSVWIYAYSKGLHSAREIARQMEHEPGLEWLTGLRPINHHTLSDFRVSHGAALRELFVQVLAMLTKNGLITLERVAADGTKIRANAGRKSFRHKNAVREHLRVARSHVEELERQEAEEQTTKRQQAARRRAAEERERRLENALEEIERLQAAKKSDKSKPQQASMSDPEARFMRHGDGGIAPAYNVQLAADAAHGLIVDVETVDDPQDAAQLPAAMERVKTTFGRYPEQALADGGYTNHPTVVAMAEREIDFYGTMSGRSDGPLGTAGGCDPDYRFDRFRYDEAANEMVCPEDKRLRYRGERGLAGGRKLLQWAARGEDCRDCAAKQKCCPKLKVGKRGRSVSVQLADPAVEAFDRKMQTPEAQAIYKQRPRLIEFPNAWIKTKLGLRRFATRGLDKVRCEALWAALTFNLQRAFRLAPYLASA